jgi:fructokinase
MKTGAVCFGEVLWDNLPDGPVPGGAPMNVAIRLASLGHRADIISAVGNDQNGSQLTAFLQERGVGTTLLQRHPSLPTGEVHVTLDHTGQPSYEIVAPAAWDHIRTHQENIDAVASSEMFIFGSLSSRNDASRSSLLRLLDVAPFKVFDVNLRSPFYSVPFINDIMERSDLIKMNDEELRTLCGSSSNDSIESDIRTIAARTPARIICVTKGKNGAVVHAGGRVYEHPGYQVQVTDTVGAGDSFLSGFVSELRMGKEVPDALNFACALGALVATKKGANPEIPIEMIGQFVRDP